MNRQIIELVAVGGLVALLAGCGQRQASSTDRSSNLFSNIPSSSMTISSPAFANNELIPVIYTCDGQNINPPLQFVDVPTGTKSLTLIMNDPDVPKNLRPDGNYDHWLLWNIPANVTTIDAGATPAGAVVGNNTAGQSKYAGPCPPDREHRYFFRVYALDTTLDLPPSANKVELLNALDGHVLASAEMVGRYARK